jgi:hypothetical protein
MPKFSTAHHGVSFALQGGDQGVDVLGPPGLQGEVDLRVSDGPL